MQAVKIGRCNTNYSNTMGSFNNTFSKSNKDAQILDWLSPLELTNRHQGLRTDRFEGVGN